MKIKQLDVAGFRSLKNVRWQPGDLNVVIGQNGTGKSNLLRMLELISISAQGRLSKYIQAAGGMGALLWDGVAPSICTNLKVIEPECKYELELARLGTTSSYFVQHELLVHYTSEDQTQRKIFISHTERNNKQPKEGESHLSDPYSPHSLHPVPMQFRSQLNKIVVYNDLNVSQDSKIRQAAVARFEKQIEPDGQNLVQVLHTLYTGDREYERSIDIAMSSAFGADYEKLVFTPDAGDQRVQMRVRWRSLQRGQSTADLSDGTLRYLLLIAILTVPDPPMLIAIDEPETGLHPTMLPIIAEFAHEASLRTQVVFTTHSPQFLDAFTDIKPTTTVTKWENGETSLHTLKGEELDYWLAEYSLGTLFRDGDLEAIA